MNEESKYLYNKAVNRLKHIGISDPTSVIVELEKEIDEYRLKIQKSESQSRLHHIQKVIGKVNYHTGTITKEDQDYLYVQTSYGTHKYSKLQLAIFWLTHSNDCFYETFGFSWIPSNKLQDIARKEINSSVKVGIDLASGEDETSSFKMPIPPIPKHILEDMLSNISLVDTIEHHLFTSFHTK